MNLGGIHTIGTLSGGAGSWGACRRWIDQNGPDGFMLLFTWVGGEDWANPNVGEDEDTMRFLADAHADLDVPLVVIRSQRTIWDVFRERKWLGNSSLAHCSWELKTGPARDWITENAPGVQRVLVGIDVTEAHRMKGIKANWAPYEAVAPLMGRPQLWKPRLLDMLAQRGIKPPRMYELGFGHANCPACVKGGHSHWARLWLIWPERYLYAEEQERLIRAEFGKNVSILTDRSGGTERIMTLEEFRHRLEDTGGRLTLFEEFTEGGCGCFTTPQPEGAPVIIWDRKYKWKVCGPGEPLMAA